MQKITTVINSIIQKYDFGYNIELAEHENWSITKNENECIASCICYFKTIDQPDAPLTKGHFFIKLQLGNLEPITIKFNIDNENPDLNLHI